MTVEEGKKQVRAFLEQFVTPEAPNVWIGEPFDIDELGFTIDASVYGQNEGPEANIGRFELDFATGKVAFCLIG